MGNGEWGDGGGGGAKEQRGRRRITIDISEKEKDPTSIPLPVGVSLPLGKGREALKPPFPGREGSRVVSYSQRKIKTRYQSLSPRGGEEWK